MTRKPKKQTNAQLLLGKHLAELGVETVAEYLFAAHRQFRFDLYCHKHLLGFECDGGMWSGGHMRGKAIESQYEKDRLAQMLGYKIMRFTNRQILNGEAKEWMRTWLSR